MSNPSKQTCQALNCPAKQTCSTCIPQHEFVHLSSVIDAKLDHFLDCTCETLHRAPILSTALPLEETKWLSRPTSHSAILLLDIDNTLYVTYSS
jgi:hypothetical protein